MIYLFCFRLKLEGGEVTRLLSGCLLDLYREEEGMDFFFLRKKVDGGGRGECHRCVSAVNVASRAQADIVVGLIFC